ncbi:hypothetical protein BUALT_BualtUnG0049000 [Buddleja alternifolia]|uniref:RING-type E3 ubiquitin transferase n=1 Tax=Buddleja alternifolia TaxID=168488 RepID=A0AAV6W3J1_9LAMI|nr:hypothetical protein BUALT_BualtUnG0049000 [Buddleja alternifolia]
MADDRRLALPLPPQLSTIDNATLIQLHHLIINFGRVYDDNQHLLHNDSALARFRSFMPPELHSNEDLVYNDTNNDDLNEEIIARELKTRLPSPDDTDDDKGVEACCVCLDDLYREHEFIGTLDCGHEYHADCIKKWLIRKNCCPLCKATALHVKNEK